MGVCCSNNKSKDSHNHNNYDFLTPTKRQLDQDEYQELSGEIKEILEFYLNNEKNSPQNKNLAESNQLKHSLEQPNTPYFKDSQDNEEKYLQLKQSKFVEEIIRSSHKNSEKLPPVEEENEQQQQYGQSKHPLFKFKCLVCLKEHNWIHSCNQQLAYNDDNMIICEKCKFKQKIIDYDFICQSNQQKFRYTTQQLKDFEL